MQMYDKCPLCCGGVIVQSKDTGEFECNVCENRFNDSGEVMELPDLEK
jgi:hypothetical protein